MVRGDQLYTAIILKQNHVFLFWVIDLDQVSWPVDWSGPLTVASREQRVSEHSDTIKNERKTKEKQGKPSVLPSVWTSALFWEDKPNKVNIIIFLLLDLSVELMCEVLSIFLLSAQGQVRKILAEQEKVKF